MLCTPCERLEQNPQILCMGYFDSQAHRTVSFEDKFCEAGYEVGVFFTVKTVYRAKAKLQIF